MFDDLFGGLLISQENLHITSQNGFAYMLTTVYYSSVPYVVFISDELNLVYQYVSNIVLQTLSCVLYIDKTGTCSNEQEVSMKTLVGLTHILAVLIAALPRPSLMQLPAGSIMDALYYNHASHWLSHLWHN